MKTPGHEAIAEFTLKAVLTGIILGLVFGAANAYLGLRVGLTVSASIPAAVLAVGIFRIVAKKRTILEANLAQTIGSASTSLASGTIFTIPALFMWGMAPPYYQIVILCFLGGVLGLSAMIPLRRLVIVEAHKELPFPEGTACAEVLRATTDGSGSSAWIFRGIALGAAIKLIVSVFFLIPGSVSFMIPVLPKARIALELAPALLGVGFILGYRQSAVLVAGSVVSALALTPLIAWIGASMTTPLPPETTILVSEMNAGAIWAKYVRYIGAGAVAVAGILTVAKNMPAMYASLLSVIRGITSGRKASPVPANIPSTERDMPAGFVVGAILFVILTAGFVPGVFAGEMTLIPRFVCASAVGIFGLLFVAVAARIVGIVGVSSQPTSGITLVTLLGIATVFAAMGLTDDAAKAAVLTVGTIVAVAASKAGDISQDLKTGFLVGATPAKQQFGQLIGAAFACWAVAATVVLLGKAYEFGSAEIPAPQATLMKTIIEGVLKGDLPWSLVLTGGGIAISAMLCGVSGLAFAIGVYLPIASMLPIFVGGCMRGIIERRRGPKKDGEHDPSVLAASGLVAGEGLAGVAVAALVGIGIVPKTGEPPIHGWAAETAVIFAAALICIFLLKAGQSMKNKK